MVRFMSGEGKSCDNLPLLTRLIDVKALVFQWALETISATKNQACNWEFFDIDFVYNQKSLENPFATLADIGVADGDELMVVANDEGPPPLVNSFDDEH